MLHTNFEKEIWIFFYVFLWFKPRTSRGGANLEPETFIWINLLKDHCVMLLTQFQASEPSEYEEDFWIFFCISMFKHRTPGARLFLDPETFIWTKLVKAN